MKIITLQYLIIKNLLSIGDEPVTINFKPGLNYITGINHDVPGTNNGCGKSTIINAVKLAIYGEAIKKLNKDQLINNITGKTTYLELAFNCNSSRGNNNFIVKRTFGPSSCTVTKDGRDKTRDSIPNTTKYILEVLSISSDIFKNCIAMSANDTVSFLNQGKVEKKRFIESLFDLDVITKMSKLVKDDINRNKSNLAVETKALSVHEGSLDSLQKKADSQGDEIEKIKKSNKERVDSLDAKIAAQKRIKESAQKTVKDNSLSEVKNKRQKCINDIAQGEGMSSNLYAQIFAFNKQLTEIDNKIKAFSSRSGSCSKCGHIFTEEEVGKAQNELDMLHTEKENIQNNISALDELKKQVDNTVKGLKIEKHDAEQLIRLIETSEAEIKRAESLIQSLEESKREVSDSIVNAERLVKTIDYNSLIRETQLQIADVSDKISQYKKESSKLDVAGFVLSDLGIKAYIIKKLLDLLNFRIRYYLVKLNAQYQLTFNEFFEETILNRKQHPVSYQNLSGAESKMLDLACIWAFRDILKLHSSVEYNVAFYDEILDSSMDATNSMIVCNILNEFAKNDKQAIYLITHKTELVKGVTGEVIFLEKREGITKLGTP